MACVPTARWSPTWSRPSWLSKSNATAGTRIDAPARRPIFSPPWSVTGFLRGDARGSIQYNYDPEAAPPPPAGLFPPPRGGCPVFGAAPREARYNTTMIRKTRLYTPGPTPLLPAAQFAMPAADIHHRTAEFRALYTRALAPLKDFVGTRNDVIILASSGTGAMEASVSNLTSPGDRVLVLSAGKFGERWTGITKAFG